MGLWLSYYLFSRNNHCHDILRCDEITAIKSWSGWNSPERSLNIQNRHFPSPALRWSWLKNRFRLVPMMLPKRPLVAVAFAFLIGLLSGEVFSFFPYTLSIFVLVFLLIEIVLFRSRLFPTSIFAIWAFGVLLFQFTSTPFLFPGGPDDLSRFVDQGLVRVVASVDSPPRHAPTHVSLRMEGVEVILDNEAHLVNGFFKLSISGEEIPFEYGDRLELLIRLRRPNQYQNPGSFLYADYLGRTGWDGVARLSHFSRAKKLGEGGNPILKTIFRWREAIRKKIRTSVDEPAASILLAMVIGESGYLSNEMREIFSSAGISHILAVSGTHLAFVSLFVFGLTRWLLLRLPESILLVISTQKIPSQWAALVTAVVATLYALLAGGKIGTMRALTMILIYLLSIWIGRNRDTKVSLSLAALLILLFHPQAIFEISFLLSFSAVISIVLFVKWWKEGASREDPSEQGEEEISGVRKYLVNPIRLFFLTTLGAALGTALLTLYFFHQFSWVSLASNLVLMPIAGWVLIPFSLLSALFPTESFFFKALHELLWSSFYALTRLFSGFPGADFHFASPPLLLVILYYSMFFFTLTTEKSRKWFFTLTAFFFVVFLGWGGLRITPGNLRVTFLDVGQGDATLIEFPHGKTMLIDGGTKRAGKFAIAPFLWQKRIRTIDYLVGTHPEFDHIGGLPYILRKFNVKTVWSSGLVNKTRIFRSFKSAIEETGALHEVMTRSDAPLEIDGCLLFFLHPSGNQSVSRDDLNNSSVVFRMSCPSHGENPLSFLFTGDIEKEAEEQLVKSGAILASTVLKVPHHGSRSSSGDAFISKVSPEIALFSVGRKNRYRHPHPEIEARYDALGTESYRTDQEGAVFIETGNDIKGSIMGRHSVETYLDRKLMRIKWSDALLRQEWDNIKKTVTIF